MPADTLLTPLGSFAAWLFKTSWQASVLIGLVLLAQWALRKHLTPGWRYGLWLLVLIRLMLPAAPPSPFSIFNFSHASLANVFEEERTQSQSRSLTAERVVPAPVSSVGDSRSANSAQPRTDGRAGHEGQARAKSFSETGGAGDPRNEAGAASRSVISWPGALTFAWLAGALLLVARVVWIPVRLNAQLARRHSVVNSSLLEILEESQQCMGVRKVLPIVQSAAVDSPALMGFIRPWLLLPEGMAARFTPQELRFVFLHELAHLKRRDIAVNWLMTLLQILHWFNPLVWFAFSRMRADRELACDALALSRAGDGDKEAYGETIIKLLESFTRPAPMAGLVGILEDKQQMKGRIAMIAQYKQMSAWQTLAPTLAVALSLVGVTDAQTEKSTNDNETVGASPSSGLTVRKLPDKPRDIWFKRSVSPDGRYLLAFDKSNGKPAMFDFTTGITKRFEPRIGNIRFTADGKQILGVRRGGQANEVILLDPVTEITRPVCRIEDARYLDLMDSSSDGRQVLVNLSKEKDKMEIASISIGDGALQVVKRFDTNAYPVNSVFSPDVRWVAFDFRAYRASKWDLRRDIHVLAADGSREIPLVEHPGADDQLLGWAPSGDWIVFASDRRGTWDAYMIKVADGHAVGDPVFLKAAISRGPLFSDLPQCLGFSPNGALYYISETDNSDVSVAALDPASGKVQGKPTRATKFEGGNKNPTWSHDGRYLAYISRHGQISQSDLDGTIWIQDRETGLVRELATDAGIVSFPHWSSDGRSLFAVAWATGNRPAYRIDVESGKSTVIAEKVRLIYNAWPMWSWAPDGKSFYQPSDRTHVTRHDLGTGADEKITVPNNNSSIVLSPDGGQFVYSVIRRDSTNLVSRTIGVVPVGGGEPRKLVMLAGPEAIPEMNGATDQGLAWTHDSRYVLFVKGSPTDENARSVWRVPVVGGEPEALGLEVDRLREPVVSPDGRWIAFASGGSKKEVWVMENFLPPQKTVAK